MTQHSKFSPSSMARILTCPSSVEFIEFKANVLSGIQNKYAAEGEMLHEYTRRLLETDFDPMEKGLTREQANMVEECVDYVKDLQTSLGTWLSYSEQKVILNRCPEVYGTADKIIAGIKGNVITEIHVIDYKFGYNQVSVGNNAQLMTYMQGAIDLLSGIYDFNKPRPELHIHILQPRINHMVSQRVSWADLEKFYDNVSSVVALINEGKSYFNPTDEHCKWCKVAIHCNAKIQKDEESIEQIYKAVTSMADNEVPTEKLLELYSHRDAIEKVFKDIHDYILYTLGKGEAVPGYKMVRGVSRRRWKEEVSVSLLLQKFPDFDIEDIIEQKMVSPAQFEKLLSKDERSRLGDLVDKPEGALQVAPESSSKPAVQCASLEDIYKDVIAGAFQ